MQNACQARAHQPSPLDGRGGKLVAPVERETSRRGKGKNRFRHVGEFAVADGKILVDLGGGDNPKNGVRRELVFILVFGMQTLVHLLAPEARFGTSALSELTPHPADLRAPNARTAVAKNACLILTFPIATSSAYQANDHRGASARLI
jgi:hypothetical protein